MASENFNWLLKHLRSTSHTFGLMMFVLVSRVWSFCCWLQLMAKVFKVFIFNISVNTLIVRYDTGMTEHRAFYLLTYICQFYSLISPPPSSLFIDTHSSDSEKSPNLNKNVEAIPKMRGEYIVVCMWVAGECVRVFRCNYMHYCEMREPSHANSICNSSHAHGLLLPMWPPFHILYSKVVVETWLGGDLQYPAYTHLSGIYLLGASWDIVASSFTSNWCLQFHARLVITWNWRLPNAFPYI